MNKYHRMLGKILEKGKKQENKKGAIIYLLNQAMELKPLDLLELFEGHRLARKKTKGRVGAVYGQRTLHGGLQECWRFVVGLLRAYLS